MADGVRVGTSRWVYRHWRGTDDALEAPRARGVTLAYLSNDARGHAPRDAIRLRELIG